jgi:hypothetical protein
MLDAYEIFNNYLNTTLKPTDYLLLALDHFMYSRSLDFLLKKLKAGGESSFRRVVATSSQINILTATNQSQTLTISIQTN